MVNTLGSLDSLVVNTLGSLDSPVVNTLRSLNSPVVNTQGSISSTAMNTWGSHNSTVVNTPGSHDSPVVNTPGSRLRITPLLFEKIPCDTVPLTGVLPRNLHLFELQVLKYMAWIQISGTTQPRVHAN